MSISFNDHLGMKAYLQARFNSIFHIRPQSGPSLVGSNNAANPYVKPTQTPDTRPPVPGFRGGRADMPGSFGGYGLAQNMPYMTGGGQGSNPNYDDTIIGGVMHNDWSIAGSHAPDLPNPNGIPSFAAGGMMGADGGAIRPGAPARPNIPADEPQMGADEPMPMDGPQIDQEAQRFVQANPQVVQQIQAVMQHAMKTGELTYQELNMAIQLAKTALANPASYPQVRQFAIKNGLGTEATLPQTIDRGLLFTLLLVGKTLQTAPGAQGGSAPAGGNMTAPQGQSKGGLLPEYGDGGMTGDKKHLAVLHPEEYVVPRDVVLYHGTKHMDNLVKIARTPKDDSNGA